MTDDQSAGSRDETVCTDCCSRFPGQPRFRSQLPRIRLPATRLYEYTDDPGMQDMLSHLITRDTLHQNQWLAALESLEDPVSVPASFPQETENQEVNYAFMPSRRDPQPDTP